VHDNEVVDWLVKGDYSKVNKNATIPRKTGKERLRSFSNLIEKN